MPYDFPVTVPDIAVVPDQFKTFYAAGADGSHVLRTDDPTITLAATTIGGMQKALLNERAAHKKTAETARGQKAVDMTPLLEFGADPVTAANAIKTRIEELQTQLKTAGKADTEQLKAQLKTAYDAEKSKDTKRIEALTGSMYKHVVVSQATAAIASQKGDTTLLMPFVQQQIRVAEDDAGDVIAQVVDGAGNLRYSAITPGQPMSIGELVAEMKASTTYGKLFESTTPSGSGKRPASGGIPQITGTKTPMQKIASGLKNRG